ncbi:ribosome maturation factor RimP [Melioribacteraceae bacterium 4301-Me]|uniref:ribosome maturation factor RimP n=1 Tax=Pyranulibacter aquaticus TaxID=3163344 RepID=UPI003596227E
MEKQDLLQKFEAVVNSLNYLFIDLRVRGDSKLKIIELFVDNEKGITSEDCTIISKEIKATIEKYGLIESDYRLDVSSPGVDRPLKYLEQYKKHLNRKFELEYMENEQLHDFVGRLINITGNQLSFSNKQGEIKINFDNIKKARVLISF